MNVKKIIFGDGGMLNKMVKRTERGWAGHFIGGNKCRFRRNTLLETDIESIIVSTVGAYDCQGSIMPIGSAGRYYETMAFRTAREGPYTEIDVTKQISFGSDWKICADSPEELPDDVDNQADAMHETVVAEIMGRMNKAMSQVH